MSPPLSHEVSIKPSSSVNRRDRDDDRVLKLIRAREYDSRDVGQHLEQILKRCFHRRECSSVIIFNFLELQHMSAYSALEAEGWKLG